MMRATRDYEGVHAEVRASVAAAPDASRERRMHTVVNLLWEALRHEGVSWLGFYIADPAQPEDQRLVLGACRNKPACSPIGLHGVCGQAYLSRQIQIVRDVSELGGNYVACDPRDKSEIVVPLFEHKTPSQPSDRALKGACWGVFDVDSHEVGAFDEGDSAGLTLVLEAAGFIAA